VAGDESHIPHQGKYNGGQKLLFWLLSLCLIVLLLTGLALWRAWFNLPVELVRISAVLHAASAALLIILILIHIYAAIWTKGSVSAMVRGTVTRGWARKHHLAWYREVTGSK
jgi:formate dehydrogenase subunit gamma